MDLLQQTDAIFFDKTGLDLARTQKIVSDALASGDDGELFLEMRHSEMLMFDDGRLKTAAMTNPAVLACGLLLATRMAMRMLVNYLNRR